MSSQGHIQVIYGPMFSGKSSELLRKVRRYEHSKKKCLIINHEHDQRYSNDNCIATHDNQIAKALKTSNLSSIENATIGYDVVAIDEGQFFLQIVQFCEKLANQGTIVIVAGLDGTFQRKPFGNIINLLPIAQNVVKLSAICYKCGKQAAFSVRIIESQQIQLIGGEQSYQPACRKCFNMSKIETEIPSREQTVEKNINIDLKEISQNIN